jgi:hypothetical protein
MIIITALLLISIYNNLMNKSNINANMNANMFNLFNEKNKLLAMIIFTIEGIVYLSISYYRKDTKCVNLRDFLIFMGLYNILLGISLFLMRITKFLIYLLIFYMIMSIIIITIIIQRLY